MRKIALFVLVLMTIGCVPEKLADKGEQPQSVESPIMLHGDCVVNREWLNLDYDHEMYGEKPDIPTDFFMLVYSNSPSFCDYMKKQGRLSEVPFQCTSPNKFGWVIHGLWGESKSAYIKDLKDQHPRFCQGDLEPLSLETITPFLCMSPGTLLLQGEWEKHGACDFDLANDYFLKTHELYERFKTPPANLNAKNAVQWMMNNNSELKDKRLNLTNHEFGICFTTDFNIMSCPNKE